MVCLCIAGAEADDQCAGPPGEAQHSGSHTRTQQALLQHCHQLPQGQLFANQIENFMLHGIVPPLLLLFTCHKVFYSRRGTVLAYLVNGHSSSYVN